MTPRGQRGMVLVACLLLLAMLSLLGAASIMSSSLDARLAANQEVSKEAFYAAEAVLEVGLGRVMNAFRSNLRPYIPTAAWTAPAGGNPTDIDPYAGTFNGYTTEYRISNALNPLQPNTLPAAYPYATVENNQNILHFAYTYNVQGRSSSASSNPGAAEMTETIRILETPLVQYYIFFNDDLSWHPGPRMNSWGRVHTNGNLLLSPETGGLYFRNYDDRNNWAPNIISASGSIYWNSYLQEGGGAYSTRATFGAYVRYRNLDTNPAAEPGDYMKIDTNITTLNRATQEPRFVDAGTGANGVYHVRVGVNPLPTPSSATLDRDGFYDQESLNPQKPKVDGIRITSDAGVFKVEFTLNGGATENVTTQVQSYTVDGAGTTVNFATWPAGAKVRGDGTSATTVAGATGLLERTMVYCPEAIVKMSNAGVDNTYTRHRSAVPAATDRNLTYPCILGRQDVREGKDVDLTVIDLQRLELWYRDKLDRLDDNAVNGSNTATLNHAMNPRNRLLLIYASRSRAGTPTAGALQGVKLIGSNAGRSRGAAVQRQTDPTLLARTTVVTDNALYLDGDFNSPSATPTVTAPGAFGCALICDAITLLSNSYGRWAYNGNGGAPGVTAASETTFNAAIFAGRYNFRAGGSGEEAGVHNFPRFLENWGTVDCNITGCLINLWFSRQATAEFNLSGAVYSPPNRNFGWDVGFGDQNYWPPYVPSIYSVQRSVWREQ